MSARCQTYEGCRGEGVLDDLSDSGSGRTVYCDCDAGKELHAIEQPATGSSPSPGGSVSQLDCAPTGAPGVEQPGEGRGLSGIHDFWKREGLIGSREIEAVDDSFNFERWAEIREERSDKMVRDRGSRIPGVDR